MSHSTMYDPKFDAGLWLSSVVDNSGDAILSKTLDGVITSWNAGAEKLFGFSAAEAIGQPITLIIPEDRLHEEAEIIGKLRAGERVDRFETVRRRSDGEPVHIEVTISPVRNAEGEIIGASKIARDIGERLRHAEDQRLLVREMHHRIKNLLSIVQGLVSVGRRRADDVDDFADNLSSRIIALGAAQQLVLGLPGEERSGAALSELIGAVLEPYRDEGQITVAQCDAPVGAGASTSLALLMHELATNAVKYGALSNSDGLLQVDISMTQGNVTIAWRERGGTFDNGDQGFGTELMRAAMRGLGGTIEQAWRDSERVVTICLARDHLTR
ncbi:sensor histidine kinase [Sphingobium yanoikuyae]|jgi:PAS domain S-box-containing protein|uniref:sensor histidine kinase n=1 Tax=Sphingobium yanoikuyae TaxID=13690 RepID=UPI002FDECEE4